MFSISTVASSTRMPTASASPPSVITLSDWPSRLQHDDRREDRQRNRHGDDQRAAPAARGRAGSSRPSAAPAIDALRARTPVDRGRARRATGRRAARSRGPAARRPGCVGSISLTLLDDVERRGVAVLEDREQRRRAAVAARTMLVCTREAVAHLGHVAQVDGGAVDDLDRDVVERGERVGAAVEADAVFARRRSCALPVGRVRFWALIALLTSAGRDRPGLQRLRIEIDHDLPRLAAVRQRAGSGPGSAASCVADTVDAVVVDLRLRQRLAAEGELQDRHARGVVSQDDRRHARRAACAGGSSATPPSPAPAPLPTFTLGWK